jgi:hypothetical protein
MSKIVLSIVFSLLSCFSNAQSKKAKHDTVAIAMPLIFSTYWGPVGTGNAPAAQIAAIAPAAILVRDNAGKLYPVNGFRINYKFKSTYRDDESGQTKSMSDLRVGDFNNTAQLSQVWAESIKDNVKPGDTILFNQVLFRNVKGKQQLAPALKIVVR